MPLQPAHISVGRYRLASIPSWSFFLAWLEHLAERRYRMPGPDKQRRARSSGSVLHDVENDMHYLDDWEGNARDLPAMNTRNDPIPQSIDATESRDKRFFI